MQTITYSDEFVKAIEHLHRGMEDRPEYPRYISAHLSGPTSRMVTYVHQLRPEIEYHCGELAGKRVLDFGCGTGATTVALAMVCERVVAFDIDEESMEICKLRLREHGLEDRVERFVVANAIEDVAAELGSFDVILMNGVIEHIPLSITGLRERVLRQVFDLVKPMGYLFIADTPNRIYPYDDHTTQLWWIPWTKPGSRRAYERAVARGRFRDAPTYSEGTLGFEQEGAWGATYWEILAYLKPANPTVVNLLPGHNRHVHYAAPPSRKRALFERVMYYLGTKPFRAPLTAFVPYITNLVLRRPAG